MLIENERNPALDLVRIVAAFCVVSEHFFLNSGFYEIFTGGKPMHMMCILRNFFMVCVPLFLILTGYLMNRKMLSIRYYAGIKKTLVIYGLASAACYGYANKSFEGFWKALFAFEAAEYSWYIEMYIGLFLLIPFLNEMYRGKTYTSTENREHNYKTALITTLILITALPEMLEIFVQILPNWWTSIYPLTYYMIGCYLSEYGLKLKRKTSILLLLCLAVTSGTITFYRGAAGYPLWEQWSEFSSLLVLCQAVLVFNLISTLDLRKLPRGCKRVLAIVSNLCLGAYLVSQIFDDAFYRVLRSAVENITVRFRYFPILVCAIFACSLALSGVMELIYLLSSKSSSYLLNKLRNPVKRI